MVLLKIASNLFRSRRICPLYMYGVKKCSTNSGAACHRSIGCREIVGFGMNGDCSYIDHPAFPYPAIRFREITPDLLPLKEKEKGDWKMLSTEEKKILYRASFCQTYAEMLAPSGEWKTVVGKALFWTSVGLWFFLGLKWLWSTELPPSYEDERRKEQLKRMLVLEVNPVHGISSKWDYENNRWK